MEHTHQTTKHPYFTNFLFFGGLSAALWWTLYIVWVCLVGVADEIRKIQ
jgi:hypothetical protein